MNGERKAGNGERRTEGGGATAGVAARLRLAAKAAGQIGRIGRIGRIFPYMEAVAELSTTAKSKLADFEKISGQGDLSLSE